MKTYLYVIFVSFSCFDSLYNNVICQIDTFIDRRRGENIYDRWFLFLYGNYI